MNKLAFLLALTLLGACSDSSNRSRTATDPIEVADTTAPVVVAPQDLQITASTTAGSPATDADLVDFLAAATATDDVGVDGAITNDAPSTFPVGTTTVTFSAQDAAGNIGTATADVVVAAMPDTTDPVVTTPADVELPATILTGASATETAIASFLDGATATDNIGVVGEVVNDAPTSFPYGQTTVTFTATDAAGNEGTASAVVWVVLPETSHLFAATDGSTGLELWRTDGTEAGTVLVRDINPAGDALPLEFVRVDQTFYFSADDGSNGRELWKSDGSASGTVLVKDIASGLDGSDPEQLTAVGERVYFVADDGVNGEELWTTDGSDAGTLLVHDIRPGSDSSGIYELTALNDGVIFAANDGTTDFELWGSDGTASGTTLLADIHSTTNSYPSGFVLFRDAAYFSATSLDNGRELWRTDGTAANTTIAVDIAPGADSSELYQLKVLGAQDTGLLVLAARGSLAQGYEPWVSDGTPAGTALLLDIAPTVSPTSSLNGSFPQEFVTADNALYFRARSGSNGANELWLTDGTTVGTRKVQDTPSGPTFDDVRNLSTLGAEVFFEAFSSVSKGELWKSDGSEAGTIVLTSLNPSGQSNPEPTSLAAEQYSNRDRARAGALLVAADGSGLMAIETQSQGKELWKTDGTPGNTVLIKDINPGQASALVNARN